MSGLNVYSNSLVIGGRCDGGGGVKNVLESGKSRVWTRSY